MRSPCSNRSGGTAVTVRLWSHYSPVHLSWKLADRPHQGARGNPRWLPPFEKGSDDDVTSGGRTWASPDSIGQDGMGQDARWLCCPLSRRGQAHELPHSSCEVTRKTISGNAWKLGHTQARAHAGTERSHWPIRGATAADAGLGQET